MAFTKEQVSVLLNKIKRTENAHVKIQTKLDKEGLTHLFSLLPNYDFIQGIDLTEQDIMEIPDFALTNIARHPSLIEVKITPEYPVTVYYEEREVYSSYSHTYYDPAYEAVENRKVKNADRLTELLSKKIRYFELCTQIPLLIDTLRQQQNITIGTFTQELDKVLDAYKEIQELIERCSFPHGKAQHLLNDKQTLKQLADWKMLCQSEASGSESVEWQNINSFFSIVTPERTLPAINCTLKKDHPETFEQFQKIIQYVSILQIVTSQITEEFIQQYIVNTEQLGEDALLSYIDFNNVTFDLSALARFNLAVLKNKNVTFTGSLSNKGELSVSEVYFNPCSFTPSETNSLFSIFDKLLPKKIFIQDLRLIGEHHYSELFSRILSNSNLEEIKITHSEVTDNDLASLVAALERPENKLHSVQLNCFQLSKKFVDQLAQIQLHKPDINIALSDNIQETHLYKLAKIRQRLLNAIAIPGCLAMLKEDFAYLANRRKNYPLDEVNNHLLFEEFLATLAKLVNTWLLSSESQENLAVFDQILLNFNPPHNSPQNHAWDATRQTMYIRFKEVVTHKKLDAKQAEKLIAHFIENMSFENKCADLAIYLYKSLSAKSINERYIQSLCIQFRDQLKFKQDPLERVQRYARLKEFLFGISDGNYAFVAKHLVSTLKQIETHFNSKVKDNPAEICYETRFFLSNFYLEYANHVEHAIDQTETDNFIILFNMYQHAKKNAYHYEEELFEKCLRMLEMRTAITEAERREKCDHLKQLLATREYANLPEKSYHLAFSIVRQFTVAFYREHITAKLKNEIQASIDSSIEGANDFSTLLSSFIELSKNFEKHKKATMFLSGKVESGINSIIVQYLEPFSKVTMQVSSTTALLYSELESTQPSAPPMPSEPDSQHILEVASENSAYPAPLSAQSSSLWERQTVQEAGTKILKNQNDLR